MLKKLRHTVLFLCEICNLKSVSMDILTKIITKMKQLFTFLFIYRIIKLQKTEDKAMFCKHSKKSKTCI